MIYLVSGYMSTGTTMMMEAFEASGMEAWYEDENYELPKETIARASLNPHQYDGKLFKIIAGGLLRLAAWRYQVIYMQRDYHEIKASCDRRFGDGHQAICSEEDHGLLTRYTCGVIDMRKDIQWIGIQYRAVLEDPLQVFTVLENCGWPVEPTRAAAVVDQRKCHHKREALNA